MALTRSRYRPARLAGLACGGAIPLALAALLCPGGASAARLKPRIVGGHSVSIKEFPFQVALYDPKALNPKEPANVRVAWFCGGIILDATHIITAAHCVTRGGFNAAGPQEMEVLAGTENLEQPGPGAVEDPVAVTSFDPEWNPLSGSHDIGVLKLQNPLWGGSPPELNGVSTIAPVPLASVVPSPGAGLTVSGWGYTEPLTEEEEPSNKNGYPATLQAANVPLIADSQCVADYASRGLTIEPDMVCAAGSSGSPDACVGDSGGPLVIDGAENPKDYELLGIVDLGSGCGQQGSPGVYQSVVNPGNASFARSDPPQAPLSLSAPSISGTPRVGRTITCDPGSWAGEPKFLYAFFRDASTLSEPLAALPLTPSYSSGATYTVQATDAETRIFCVVAAFNRGGYGEAIGADASVPGAPQPPPATASSPPAPPPPPPPAPPTLQVVSKRCKQATCTINVLASEGTGPTAVTTVEAKLTFKRKTSCRKHGRRASCTRAVTRKLTAQAIPGDHFVVVASGLKPGVYTLTLTAIDMAGVHQTPPTRVALVVTRVKKNQKKK